jgi:hypothetical protein
MKVGEKLNIPCLNVTCAGSLEGTYGGEFSVGETEVKYTQVLNCKCDRCGLELAEAFEVWDEYNEEYWVSDRVNVSLNDDNDISFPGLGMSAVEMSSEFSYFLRTGQKP